MAAPRVFVRDRERGVESVFTRPGFTGPDPNFLTRVRGGRNAVRRAANPRRQAGVGSTDIPQNAQPAGRARPGGGNRFRRR